MTNNTNSKRPALEAFQVQGYGEDGKAFWTKIGAAWKNTDGKGFNLVLTCLPIDGKITLREPKED